MMVVKDMNERERAWDIYICTVSALYKYRVNGPTTERVIAVMLTMVRNKGCVPLCAGE